MVQELAFPNFDEIEAALTELNWIYLNPGNDGGVFHSELLDSRRVSPNSFKIKMRTYENWSKLDDPKSPPIYISGYEFNFEVFFEIETGMWNINGDEMQDPVEIEGVELGQLPDREDLATKIIERNYAAWSQEDLSSIQAEFIPDFIRPIFLKWSGRNSPKNGGL